MPKEGTASLGAGVTAGELPEVGSGNQTGAFCKRSANYDLCLQPQEGFPFSKLAFSIVIGFIAVFIYIPYTMFFSILPTVLRLALSLS